MKIVILNECFLHEKHLEKLRTYGEVDIFKDTTTQEDAIERLKDAEIAIADMFFTPFNKTVLESSKKLKFITLNSTGYDRVDLVTANKLGIKVSNLPGYSTQAVAEHTFALMFALARNIPLGDRAMRKKPFELDPGNPQETVFKGSQIKGKVLGIIGLGAIGTLVAQIGHNLGMKVIAYNRSTKKLKNVELKKLDDVLKESDVVSLHVPLLPELENLISEKELLMMKPSAILINTARGKLINTTALFNALKNGTIAGAGLDMLAEWTNSNPLLELDNIVLTPHSGFYTEVSMRNMADTVLENVESFIAKSPINLVK